jgi:hypothetical protein
MEHAKEKIPLVLFLLLARCYSVGAFIGPQVPSLTSSRPSLSRLRAQFEPDDPLREPYAIREDVNELIKKGQEKVTGKSLEKTKAGPWPLSRFGQLGKIGGARRGSPTTVDPKEHESVSDLKEWKALETNAKHIKVNRRLDCFSLEMCFSVFRLHCSFLFEPFSITRVVLLATFPCTHVYQAICIHIHN